MNKSIKAYLIIIAISIVIAGIIWLVAVHVHNSCVVKEINNESSVIKIA